MGLFSRKPKPYKGSWSYAYFVGDGGLEQGFFTALALLKKSADETGIEIINDLYKFQGLFVFDLASGGHITIQNEYMQDGFNFGKFDMINSTYSLEDWERFTACFADKIKNSGFFTGAGNQVGVSSKRKD